MQQFMRRGGDNGDMGADVQAGRRKDSDSQRQERAEVVLLRVFTSHSGMGRALLRQL